MSNLDNLTSKIISDAEVKKSEILKEAGSKASDIKNKKIEDAEKKAASITAKAQEESKSIKERVLSKTELEVRNNKLKAKQELIDKVFKLAVEELKTMSSDDFEKFVMNSILSLDIHGDEEIMMDDNDRAKLSENFLKELNENLLAKGKLDRLTFKEGVDTVGGGFILNRKGIEINYSFKELVNSLRYELEYQVGSILFTE